MQSFAVAAAISGNMPLFMCLFFVRGQLKGCSGLLTIGEQVGGQLRLACNGLLDGFFQTGFCFKRL